MPLPPNASITDVIDKLTELEGINQKAELASVIGSPALSTDTVAQQIVKLQTSKDTLAANLNAKGVIADNTEPIQVLASKVTDIDTGTSVSGTVNSNFSTMPFQFYNGTAANAGYVTVSGLNFKPSRIVLLNNDNPNFFITEYDATFLSLNESIRVFVVNTTSINTFSNYHYKNNVSSAYVNETGFRLPVFEGKTYTWIAYK